MNKIAKAMGYQGNMNEFQSFLEEDPQRQEQMNKYTRAAIKMATGGMATGTGQPGGQQAVPTVTTPTTSQTTQQPLHILR